MDQSSRLKTCCSLVDKSGVDFALAERDVDLNNPVCTDVRIRTGIAGAATRVGVGDCATGWDFMGAAFISSDNGAALLTLWLPMKRCPFCRLYEYVGFGVGNGSV